MNKNNRKEHLYKIAFKLFLLKGYDSVSISDIEKASGMTRGAITYYCEDKMGLFYNVVKHFFIQLQDSENKTQLMHVESLKEFIEIYVKCSQANLDRLHNIDPTVTNGSRCYISLALQICDYFPDLYDLYLRNLDKELLLWIEIIQKGISKGELKEDIDVINTAKVFMDIFTGRSFLDSLTKGLNTVDLRFQMLTVYNLLKK